MKEYSHPSTEQISLTAVLEALSDPSRLDIVLSLADQGEANCSELMGSGSSSKPNHTYHLTRLREAGVTRVRPVGTRRMVTLRWDDLNARFPGLLEGIIANARRDRQQRGLAPASDARAQPPSPTSL